MANIQWPASPTTGQTYTFEGRSWIYDGKGWQSIKADVAGGYLGTTFSIDPGAIYDEQINAAADIAISKIAGLQGALDGKLSTTGKAADSELLDGQDGSYYAPINSPALTGTPTAPTAASGTNNTQVATTEYVDGAVADLVDSAPATLDTLNELAAALGDDPNFATTLANSLAGKISTTAQFGGDVSGTYDAITVANDSHTHDGRYFTETESDARYLGITAKASDSEKLDGQDGSYYLDTSANGQAKSGSLSVGSLSVNTSTTTGPAIVQIAGATTLGTTSDKGGLSFVSTGSKTYPTTSSFAAYPGYHTEIELGTSQTVNPTTPGGYNFVYGDRRAYTKSAGNTSDIERLYFNGFQQDFNWLDANTCKQYVGISDTFSYYGADANGRTSSSLNATNLFLFPSDGTSQTISNATSPRLFVWPGGTSTISITNGYGYSSALSIRNFDAGTKTVNISNYSFYDTPNWGASGATGTLNATITNLYALRLRAPSGTTGLTVTNNWGLYQEWSSAKNWFAGASNQFPNITTTASGANAFLDSANSNRLYRSTSSITYKRDVEDLDSTLADKVLGLRPVWYRSKCEADCQEWSWYGLIAEEVAEVDPRFVHYGYQEDDYELVDVTETVKLQPEDPRLEEGIETEEITRQVRQLKADAKQVPNGVAYERLVVPLLDIIKRQKSQLESFETRLAALEANYGPAVSES